MDVMLGEVKCHSQILILEEKGVSCNFLPLSVIFALRLSVLTCFFFLQPGLCFPSGNYIPVQYQGQACT